MDLFFLIRCDSIPPSKIAIEYVCWDFSFIIGTSGSVLASQAAFLSLSHTYTYARMHAAYVLSFFTHWQEEL